MRATQEQTRTQAIDMALCMVSLYHFVKTFWGIVEKREFVDGWHIKAICDHLEAVSRGMITRLIINIPPRHSKSLIVSVFWPVWDWLQQPSRQWLFSSYAQSLSTRDSVKARRIFQSPIYQDLLYEAYPDLVLVGDQNTKIRYENSERGYRLATSVDGSLTGEGGDIIGVDDPHNVREGESETTRKSVLTWWDEAMSTRLNDSKTGAYVIIMQRVHENDLTGHILEREADEWDHLCLPARYEGKNRVRSSLGFRDPRRREGQVLCGERFGDEELMRLERSLGSYATAGQLQQRPAPRGGGMFKVEKLQTIKEINRNFIVKSVRYWDKAGSEGTGARTAGVLAHLMKNDMVIFEDIVKGQWSYGQREARILQTAHLDKKLAGKKGLSIWTEQEPGSGGKESAERTIKNLKGFDAHKETVTGNKVIRAQPLAAYMEASNVGIMAGEWVPDFIAELEVWPNGKFLDQGDGASGAFNKLCGLGTDAAIEAGTWGRK